MKISNISFRGYRENETVLACPDKSVIKALENARPYLRQIGNSMPYPKDLYITVTDDGCDTYLKAYDINKKNNKANLIAKGNEHTLTEHGLDFVQKIFEGLEKNDKKDFKETACSFVKRLNKVQEEMHPLKFDTSILDFDYDPHPACC